MKIIYNISGGNYMTKLEMTFKKLNRFNVFMGTLHLLQAIAMVVLAVVIFPELLDFEPTIIQYYQTIDMATGELITVSQNLFSFPYAIFASSFLFLSAFFHYFIFANRKAYNKYLAKGINPFRWVEYSLSSSVIILLTSMLFGILDIGSLFMIFVANAVMNLLGLEMERVNQLKTNVNWGSFILGSVIGFAPWALLAIYLLGSPNLEYVPNIVWVTVAAYFILFNAFPVNMYLQYKKIGKWKDYLYGEKSYIVLSLVAKTILAWLVFFGALQATNIIDTILG
jgi:hypothetical protein